MSSCAWIAIQVCSHGENAAFLYALIYRAARDCSSRFARTCLFAHGERSMCLRCETAAAFGRMISLCARRKFQVYGSLVHGFFAYAGRNAGDTFGYGEGRTEHERSSPYEYVFWTRRGFRGELAQQHARLNII